MGKNKQSKSNVVYSTNSDFNYNHDDGMEDETLPPAEQTLRILLDRKQRKGKTVTLISGFIGNSDDLKTLSKLLKSKCGVGGSVKDGDIIIQGEVRDKVIVILEKENYNTKRIGG